MPAAFIVLAILAVAGIAYFSYYLKQKRRDELAATAAKLGMKFSAHDPFSIDDSMPHQLFAQGDGRGCENVIWGPFEGMQATAFDYWYYTESTDSEGNRSRTYHRFSCAMTQIPVSCANLIVTKENLFTRLADNLGFRDIEFETEEFNRAWQVKCPDRKFANDFIDQRMMQWLMHAGPSWSFELYGPVAVVYCRKLSTAEVPNVLRCLKAFVEKIPSVAKDLYPAQGGSALPG